MPDSRSATRTAARLPLFAAVGLVALPVVAVILFFSEQVLFGTRHFANGIEAIGLTKVLQAILDTLGMNG